MQCNIEVIDAGHQVLQEKHAARIAANLLGINTLTIHLSFHLIDNA